MISPSPLIRLLTAAHADIRAADYVLGAELTDVTVRHENNRYPTEDERLGGCISIALKADSARSDDADHCYGEMVREATFELVGDIDVDPVADPTGLLRVMRMLTIAANALRADDSEIRKLCDWVNSPEIDPDERATSEEGRLVYAVTVVYRVKTDDLNVLLAPGVNA